jgi:hypothetical protein
MPLKGEIEHHRLDPDPHPNWKQDLPPAQIIEITTLIESLIPEVPARGQGMPAIVKRGEAGSAGASPDYSPASHRHPLELGPELEAVANLSQTGWVRRDGAGLWSARDGLTCTSDLLTEHDPKTGLVRHVRHTFWKGLLTNKDTGPWHPFQEKLDAGEIVLTPSAGVAPPVGAILFHRASDALLNDADADNVLLAPAILSEYLVISDTEVVPTFVQVPANVGQTWFGCVLPIRFRNTRESDTPAQWVIQLHDATGIPEDHYVWVNCSNKHNAEASFLTELPRPITSDDDAACMGYDGEMVVYLFLGLGIDANEQIDEPQRVPWSIQVEAWLV